MADSKHIDLKYFDIPITGLSEGQHQYRFEFGPSFFAHFESDELAEAEFQAEISLEKGSRVMDAETVFTGKVNLTCDRCGNHGLYQLSGKEVHAFKFAHGNQEDDPEVSFVDPEAHFINVAQLLYEYASTSVPSRIVCAEAHPKQTCDQTVLDRLNHLQPGPEEQNEEEIDPRWEALKKLSNP